MHFTLDSVVVQPLSKKVLGLYLGGVCMFSVCFFPINNMTMLTAYNLPKQI